MFLVFLKSINERLRGSFCSRLYTLYSKSLPLDVACRVWDVYLRDGEEFLIKTALGIVYSNTFLKAAIIYILHICKVIKF